MAVGIMGYAVSLSLSRGAVATLLAGLVALAFARSRALGFAAVGAALVLVIVGYPMFVEWRLTTEAGSASSGAAAALAASDEGRLSAVLAGPALFAMSPIFGIGFGQYKYMSALVTDQGAGLVAHNWYGRGQASGTGPRSKGARIGAECIIGRRRIVEALGPT